ncbi:hypothetical protein EON65_11135 [archaeon]|nr:MAG: hypothetical protein EON65_11135 [archaeon]
MPLIAVVGVNSYELGGEKDKEVLDKKLLSLEVYERTRQPSYQITNAIMRQTIQPVTEIKLYKVTKAESSEQHYVQTSLDSKAVLQAAGKRKALVGSEYSKYFLMKDEELIPTKEANQITRKEIAEEFQQDGQRLSEHMGNIHQIVAENRRSSHVSGTRHAEEKRRRFMADSNTHKNRVIANPTHYITKLEDHSDTEIAQWALDHTVRLPMKEIEKDLFNLEASCVTEEEPATDSSEEEVEEAGGKKQDKGVSKKYYKRGDEFNILDMDVK